MFDNYLRGIKDRLAEPVARRLSKVNPDSLTLMGLLIGIGSAVLAYFRHVYLGACFLVGQSHSGWVGWGHRPNVAQTG